MELKVAKAADVDILQSVVRQYHQFENIEMSDSARTQAITPLLGMNPLGRIWLILSSGEIIGYIALCFGYSIKFGGKDAFIDEFYIKEAVRGQGIGEAVLTAIKKEANKLGIVAIHLEVARSNNKAKKLYSKTGFRAREEFHLMSSIIKDP